MVVRAATSPPTAAVTVTTADLVARFDGSGSATPTAGSRRTRGTSGTVRAGPGVAPQHTYAADGSYTVRLTVTDDRGATTTAAKTVVVRGPAGPGHLRADGGERLGHRRPRRCVDLHRLDERLRGGLRQGDHHGGLEVAADRPAAVRSTDTDLQVGFALDRASTGGGQFVRTIVRGDETNGYGTRVWITKDGAM